MGYGNEREVGDGTGLPESLEKRSLLPAIGFAVIDAHVHVCMLNREVGLRSRKLKSPGSKARDAILT
ncbi:hypothetical protein AJ79_06275 [Helicocarpus griseus UAMH5409]|uniref:Uncharacterized protein n=1 Tax=Helicocarpus griseus UAMH5409 TaxID=1447875 RepID=A0A2B7XF58_9EURO|nr:hypothetical protein AJ79_06275 [Helicocarpus griseus UAMH5409]